MEIVLGKCLIKLGIHSSICLHVGKGKRSLSSLERKQIHVVNKRLYVPSLIPKRTHTSATSKPSLKTNYNWIQLVSYRHTVETPRATFCCSPSTVFHSCSKSVWHSQENLFYTYVVIQLFKSTYQLQQEYFLVQKFQLKNLMALRL